MDVTHTKLHIAQGTDAPTSVVLHELIEASMPGSNVRVYTTRIEAEAYASAMDAILKQLNRMGLGELMSVKATNEVILSEMAARSDDCPFFAREK